MAQAGQMLVAAHRGMQHVAGCHAQRQWAGIDDLQPVRIQVEVDVAPLGIGAVHQGIGQQLTDHPFVECRHLRAKQPFRHLVELAEVRHIAPYRIHQLHRRQGVIVPGQLVDLVLIRVALDELDDRRRSQPRPVDLPADA
ncbi:hypothetical protein D9M70_570080 [compost metagenome]